MWQPGISPVELVARATVVYLLFLVALRLSGKRELGQFAIFDLALVLLAANALQPAMTGADQSVTGGLILLGTFFALNRVVAEARVRVPLVRRLLELEPTTIGRNGRWLYAELVRQGVDLVDAEAALREHGLASVRQMRLATLEEDGSISIVAADRKDEAEAEERRRRYRRSRS